MKRSTIVVLSILVSLISSQAAQVVIEPDDYAVNAYLPDNLGVKLRNSGYVPTSPYFSESWRRLRAKAPDSYPTIQPSTGSMLIGNDYSAYHNGYDYGMRAWFVNADNTWKETSYVSFDICWPTSLTLSEGVLVQAWANDSEGVNSRVFSQVYTPDTSPTRFSLYHEGITQVRAICYDNPSSFRSKYFSTDNLRFTDTSSGSRFSANTSAALAAPSGLTLNAEDLLDGIGTVGGDVFNGGFVAPGNSPGTLYIDGDYTQTAAGELTIELAGTSVGEYDVLSVSGDASLDGTLRVEFVDGFVPTEVDGAFTIMEYGSYSGQFSSIITPDGVEMGLDYSVPGELNLSVIPEPGTLVLLVVGSGSLVAYRRKRNVRDVCMTTSESTVDHLKW